MPIAMNAVLNGAGQAAVIDFAVAFTLHQSGD